MVRKIGTFLLVASLILPISPTYAGTDEEPFVDVYSAGDIPTQEYLGFDDNFNPIPMHTPHNGLLDLNRINTPLKDHNPDLVDVSDMEPSKKVLQRRKEKIKQERKEAQKQKKLDQLKSKFMNECNNTFYEKDKKLYNKILMVVSDILSPLCRNNQENNREAIITAGMDILTQLVTIHQTQEYQTATKTCLLEALLTTAQQARSSIHEETLSIVPFSIQDAPTTELRRFYGDLITDPISISGGGGNISLGFMLGIGGGGFIGSSKDICGKRKLTLGSQLLVAKDNFFGLQGGFGYNQFQPAKRTTKKGLSMYGSKTNSDTIACGVGASFPSLSEELDAIDDNHFLFDGVFGVALGSLRRYTGAVDVCSLSKQDFNMFRKNIGLGHTSGKLPLMLERLITECFDPKQIRNALDLYEKYRVDK